MPCCAATRIYFGVKRHAAPHTLDGITHWRNDKFNCSNIGDGYSLSLSHRFEEVNQDEIAVSYHTLGSTYRLFIAPTMYYRQHRRGEKECLGRGRGAVRGRHRQFGSHADMRLRTLSLRILFSVTCSRPRILGWGWWPQGVRAANDARLTESVPCSQAPEPTYHMCLIFLKQLHPSVNHIHIHWPWPARPRSKSLQVALSVRHLGSSANWHNHGDERSRGSDACAYAEATTADVFARALDFPSTLPNVVMANRCVPFDCLNLQLRKLEPNNDISGTGVSLHR